jgi:NAD(P)-dependent dehydrogenase (short-subunit alcohol dehydrogenase family)
MSVVLVTGASSGFGCVIAAAFAEAGHTVIATLRNPDAAPEPLKARVGPDFALTPLDVTDPASREAALAEVIKRFGRLDVLVNNAGIGAIAAFEDTPPAVVRQIFETNYFGPSELMRLVFPIFREQGGGRIVNVTAIGAILATPLAAAYCASKHAMDATSAALDIEGRPFGVRVASVLPGPFATDIGAKSTKLEASAPYRGMLNHMMQGRAAAGPPPSDLTPVVEATIAAATDAEPSARYLVHGRLADVLIQTMPELARLQAFEAARAGVGAA